MRQFPHSQSHIRMENVSEISLQCMKKISLLEKDSEVHLELQYNHFFINFIQALLQLGRILTLLIFPQFFTPRSAWPLFSVMPVPLTLCSHMVRGILVPVLSCVSFPCQARNPAEQQLPELGNSCPEAPQQDCAIKLKRAG